MRYSRHLTHMQRAAYAVVMSGVWAVGLSAQSEPSVESIEVKELKAALELSQHQLAVEQKRSADLETQRKTLVESLSEAVRVSEEQMVSARETELKLQAFGVDLFTRDDSSIEQRLLKAVRDLDIAQQEIERRTSAILQLSEAFLKVLNASPGLADKDKAEAEAAIAAANEALSAAPAEGEEVADVSKSRVISVDSSVGLIVVNAGRRSGIRVGTPIAVLRGEKPVYSAMVVDVRDSISGAVLQDRMVAEGDVEVGDGIRLLPVQRNL